MSLIFVSIAIFLLYIGSIVFMFGVPWSISNTYYLLKEKRKGLGILFTLFCYSAGGCLLPGWLEVTPSNYQYSCFLSVAGLLFAGAAAQFKESMTYTIHIAAAIICCIFSQIWCIMAGYGLMSLFSFAYFLCIAGLSKKKNWMFWIEVAAIIATYVSIIYEIKKHEGIMLLL